MRNLKKILALVLALVMSLSLMATAGAADFPDSDGITNDAYALAVDILSDLNVFVGDQNGKFNPDQNITRAEVAAIIYRISTGDVTNEKNNTYTSYGQFGDVINGDWYEGYVTYCAIAGYVKGRSDGNFWPKDYVTGYEVLAMILRAVGYDKGGEFVGTDWQINTARIARENGILDNITNDTSVQLGEYVTREVVAEILFQAIQVPQVTWSIVSNTYTKDGPTLAKEHLGMESVTGVVMANEWANINENGSSVLADGKTELKPAGEAALTLEISTDLDAVGQTYTAYIQDGTRVLGSSLARSDSNVVAFNDGKSVNVASLTADETHSNSKNDEGYASIAAMASEQGIRSIADAEYFLDYSLDYSFWDNTEILIRYAVDKDAVDNDDDWNQYRIDVDNGEYPGHLTVETRKVHVNWDEDNDLDVDGDDAIECYIFTISPEYSVDGVWYNTRITPTDKEIMQRIFYTADRLGENVNPDTISQWDQRYVYGEVYVGTSSAVDVSDTMSWNEFTDTYFVPEDTVNYDGCGNGQSLRVIDNDGDGSAEYIFKVQYWQDKAIDEYNDALEFYELVPSRNAYWDGGAENYAVGDVVNYRVIDGKTTVWKAEKITDVIDTKNFKDITVTPAEHDAMGQSDIWNNTNMSDNIMNMLDKTEYNMYLDQFGYIRTYELAQGSQYALIAEIYNTTSQAYNYINNSTYIAEVKAGEAELEEFVVSNWRGNPFISTYAWTTRTTRYYNGADLNFLQPAVAHLNAIPSDALANQFMGATQGATPTYYLTGTNSWNRGVFDMVSAAAAGASSTNTPATDYGVFDYGSVNYPAYTSAGGNVAAGTAYHSFSFTNVAAYTMDGDTVSLNTAAQLAIDSKTNQQLYRVGYGITSDPVTQLPQINPTVAGSAVSGQNLLCGMVGTKAQLIAAWTADRTAVGTPTTEQQQEDWWNANYSGATYANGTDRGVNKNGTMIYPVYAVDYVQLDLSGVASIRSSTRHYSIDTSYGANFNSLSNGYVNAIADTEFYIVRPNRVDYYESYADLPTIYTDDIRAAYAVATNTAANAAGVDYWVADVIVIETADLAQNSWDSVSLMYYNPFETSNSVRYVQSLNSGWAGYGADDARITVVPEDASHAPATWGNASWSTSNYGFYALFNTDYDGDLSAADAQKITSDWNDYGIYAGTVRRLNSLTGSNYFDLDRLGRGSDLVVDDGDVVPINFKDVPVYRVYNNSADTLRISQNAASSDVAVGDKLILVYDGDDLSYIVDVSNVTNYTAPGWLTDIYSAIIREQINGSDIVSWEDLDFDVNLASGQTLTVTGGKDPVVVQGTGGSSQTVTVEVDGYLSYVDLTITVTNASGTPQALSLAGYVGSGWSVTSPTPTGWTANPDLQADGSYILRLTNGSPTLRPRSAVDAANAVVLYTDARVAELLAAADATIGTGANDITFDEAQAALDELTAIADAIGDTDLEVVDNSNKPEAMPNPVANVATEVDDAVASLTVSTAGATIDEYEKDAIEAIEAPAAASAVTEAQETLQAVLDNPSSTVDDIETAVATYKEAVATALALDEATTDAKTEAAGYLASDITTAKLAVNDQAASDVADAKEALAAALDGDPTADPAVAPTADTVAKVEAALEAYKTAIDSAAALATAANDAVSTVDNFVKNNNPHNLTIDVSSAAATAKTSIKNATATTGIDTAVETYETAVVTAAATAADTAKDEYQADAIAELDEDDDADALSDIETAGDTFDTAIAAASTMDDVNDALTAYKAAVDRALGITEDEE